ncbi:MAG: response regulator transcription factor [Pseudoduganella sp.]|jgi:two-component system LytT family response regulator|nr:response regulator transcription factor [Pseudoduganella sp.]
MMRVLVVDDERLARQELRRLLAAHPQVEVVGEAASVAGAIALATSLAPDLLLLNEGLPDGSAYDVLAALEPAPEIIFTTGYGDCPPDSLLKPIRPQQLAAALERAAVRLGMGGTPRRLLIRDAGRCWFVRLTDIHLFEAEGAGTRAYFHGGSPLIARPLPQIERLLDPQQFFRASRRHIVNLADVRRIGQGGDGGLTLHVAGKAVRVAHATHHAN